VFVASIGLFYEEIPFLNDQPSYTAGNYLPKLLIDCRGSFGMLYRKIIGIFCYSLGKNTPALANDIF
jgi:hypothetical protein